MTRVRFFNCISAGFVVLSILICLVSVAWLTDTVSVPDSLRPKTEIPIPTPAVLPGLPTAAPATPVPPTEETAGAETDPQEALTPESTEASETP
jgi:hypothetical protein